MGTKFRVSFYTQDSQKAEKAAQDTVERIAALNAIFSDYEPESELSRLNRAEAGKPFAASLELYGLISRAHELSAATDGAFDITCGNLTRLWRRTRDQKKLPPPDRLQKALAATDYRALALDPSSRSLTLKRAGMLIDLGGIAKGRAADEALRLLRERHGIRRALVIAGGDIAIGTAPPDAAGWEIKLRTQSLAATDNRLTTLILAERGVSTSGDLYQYIEIDDTRYAHIVSPKTGLGLTQRIACTVIAPDCTTSDALATAMCVLGREKGTLAAAQVAGVELLWPE
ncbi:MAG: FAD:protein FMN transferase [Verrucomicrobiaceae bacterium]|nr:FAD:protein FMN transferase [Verrucomicrobiaceae bacterium]